MTDQMEYIRNKYGITIEELNNLDMDEFDYQRLKEREMKNYIKGMLFDVVSDKSTDFEQLAENIIDLSKVTSIDRLQKVILGEIGDCCMGGVAMPNQVVAVSAKISNALKEGI